MNTVTPNQYAMLVKIARSLYTTVNGAEPETLDDVGVVWLFEAIENKADNGTAVSLVNAGLIGMDQVKVARGEPPESTIWLTQAGFDAYKAGI